MKAPAMKIHLFALLIAATMTARAQDVISERTEVMPVTITPMGESSAQRDRPRMGAFVTEPAERPGPNTVMQETEVAVLAFQIPDFNPQDLYTHHYHVGMFSDSGNGSGTIFPNDDGYAEFELRTQRGETPMTTFLYSVHAETSEVRVFIDVDGVTVNRAAVVLTNLALNANMQRGQRPFGPGRPRPRMSMPPPVGDQRTVSWSGDYLTLDDLQEQIFAQTGCDVAQAEGDYRYYLVGCN